MGYSRMLIETGLTFLNNLIEEKKFTNYIFLKVIKK